MGLEKDQELSKEDKQKLEKARFDKAVNTVKEKAQFKTKAKDVVPQSVWDKKDANIGALAITKIAANLVQFHHEAKEHGTTTGLAELVKEIGLELLETN